MIKDGGGEAQHSRAQSIRLGASSEARPHAGGSIAASTAFVQALAHQYWTASSGDFGNLICMCRHIAIACKQTGICFDLRGHAYSAASAMPPRRRADGSALLARCSQSSRSSHSQTYCTSRSTSPVPGDKKNHRHLLRSYSTCRMSARSSAVPISAPSHLRLGASLRGGRPAY